MALKNIYSRQVNKNCFYGIIKINWIHFQILPASIYSPNSLCAYFHQDYGRVTGIHQGSKTSHDSLCLKYSYICSEPYSLRKFNFMNCGVEETGRGGNSSPWGRKKESPCLQGSLCLRIAANKEVIKI